MDKETCQSAASFFCNGKLDAWYEHQQSTTAAVGISTSRAFFDRLRRFVTATLRKSLFFWRIPCDFYRFC